MEGNYSNFRAGMKRRSLAEEVVDTLTEQVRTGVLKPGDKLPTESALMQTHSVSRTVVREAISRLQAAGLAESRHGIGTFVLDAVAARGLQVGVSADAPDELAMLELRLAFEVESAGLAALRRSTEQLRAMRLALETSSVEFYRSVVDATGNRYLIEIASQLTYGPEASSVKPTYEREEVYNAIARQDASAAKAAMCLHLINQRERLRVV